MPKKVLVSTVELFHRASKGRDKGLLGTEGLRLDWGAVIDRKDRLVAAWGAGERRSYEADRVLLAVGRPPNVEGLGLEAAGVAHDRRGIQVDSRLRSVSASHVYAAGDVAGHFQLSPVAWYDGALAARNAVNGDREEADYSALPSTVFTIPSLSQVGLTEEEARAKGLDVAVSRSPFANSPAADILGETEGLTKMVYEATTGRVLGVHILGPHSEDLIEVAAVALWAGLTRPQLGRLHYAFPNLAGSVVEAAIDY